MEYASLTWLGRALLPHREEIATELIQLTKKTLPALSDVPDMTAMLGASITENVVTVQHVLANNIDPSTVSPPASAVAYAQRLARRGMPLSALLRAYGLGQSRILNAAIAQILAADRPDQSEQVSDMFTFAGEYLDRITALMGHIYETERDRWISSRQAARQQWIARLLEDNTVDVAAAEAALGYRLDCLHLAAELWTGPRVSAAESVRVLEQARQLLQTTAGSVAPDLVVASGDGALRVWIPVASRSYDAARLRRELEVVGSPVRVALGPVDHGLPGFRRSARGAERAKKLASAAATTAPQILEFETIAPFALLSDESKELTALTQRALGPLARDDEKMHVLRQTLEAFLAESGSYARAATRLMVHRNTVQYRIQQITGKYGISLAGDTFDLRFALGLCRWHRDALIPPS